MKGQVIDGIVTRIDSEYFLIESGPLEAMVSYEVIIGGLRVTEKFILENQR